MKKKILNTLKYLAFTLLGILLFWLVYRDQDFTKIWHTLTHDVNYSWVILALILGLFSHISRTLRWKIALEPLGENPRTINAFIAVMLSYFMNLLLPRAGELARCGMLSKYEKISFSKLFGTVITERIIDMIMLLFAFLIVLSLEFDKVVSFGKQNPAIVDNAIKLVSSPLLWIILILLVVGIVLYLRYNNKKKGKNKLLEIVGQFTQGIKSVLSMRRYKAYIAHTFFIWTMYFLMLYMIFFSLEATRHLGILAALSTFVFASFGMLAPVQGGIGAWHFMAEKTLSVYGVESADGKLFALLAHSSTNIMVLIFGVICIILIPIVNRKYKLTEESK